MNRTVNLGLGARTVLLDPSDGIPGAFVSEVHLRLASRNLRIYGEADVVGPGRTIAMGCVARQKSQYAIAVKKSGFKKRDKKIRITGGDINLNAELDKAN